MSQFPTTFSHTNQIFSSSTITYHISVKLFTVQSCNHKHKLTVQLGVLVVYIIGDGTPVFSKDRDNTVKVKSWRFVLHVKYHVYYLECLLWRFDGSLELFNS